MKKYFFIALIAIFACNKKEEAKSVGVDSDTIKTTVNDLGTPKQLGADEDSHGCKSSAGYTWSELEGECLRIFEVATQLQAANDSANVKMPAFVIIKDKKAEIFIQTEKPFVMESDRGGVFKKGDWMLSYSQGYEEQGKITKRPMYILAKNGEILFFSVAKPVQ